MKPLNKILVYAETNDPESLEPVVELAARHDATLTLCHVISQPPGVGDAHPAMGKLHELGWRIAFEDLRALSEQHKSRIGLNTTILVGEPFLAIMKQVTLEDYDLVAHICDPEHLQSNRGLNPIAMHLARKCPGRVWSLHPGSKHSPAKIVVAVDRDYTGTNPRTETLTAALINTAAAVIKPGGELHLVHAWQAYGEKLLADQRVDMSRSEADAYLADQQQNHERWFSELVASIGTDHDFQLHPHLLRGPVAESVNGLAESVKADLIVMGTIGTSVVPGLLIGMSAEALLSETNTPVLTVKTKDFVTPLQIPQTARGAESTFARLSGDSADERSRT